METKPPLIDFAPAASESNCGSTGRNALGTCITSPQEPPREGTFESVLPGSESVPSAAFHARLWIGKADDVLDTIRWVSETASVEDQVIGSFVAVGSLGVEGMVPHHWILEVRAIPVAVGNDFEGRVYVDGGKVI